MAMKNNDNDNIKKKQRIITPYLHVRPRTSLGLVNMYNLHYELKNCISVYWFLFSQLRKKGQKNNP